MIRQLVGLVGLVDNLPVGGIDGGYVSWMGSIQVELVVQLGSSHRSPKNDVCNLGIKLYIPCTNQSTERAGELFAVYTKYSKRSNIKILQFCLNN